MKKCSCNEQIFDLKYAKMSEVFITNIIPNVVMFPSQVQLNFNFYLKLKLPTIKLDTLYLQ